MGRAPCCDKASVKKGPWSPEEDAKLKSFIEQHGTGGNWIALPQKIGLNRCGKSCRLRWLNYLRPNIKHGGFSEEEDRIICSLYVTIGSRWSIIAAQLPGRTDNDIKNYWNTKLKKKLHGKQRKEQQPRRVKQHIKGNIPETNNNNQNPYWPELPVLAPVYNNDHHEEQQVYEPQSVVLMPSCSSSSNNNIGTQFFDDRYNMLQGQSSFLGDHQIQEIMYSNNPQRLEWMEFLCGEELMMNGRLSLSSSESGVGGGRGWGDMSSFVCPPVGSSDFGGNGIQQGQAGMMHEYASFQ